MLRPIYISSLVCLRFSSAEAKVNYGNKKVPFLSISNSSSKKSVLKAHFQECFSFLNLGDFAQARQRAIGWKIYCSGFLNEAVSLLVLNRIYWGHWDLNCTLDLKSVARWLCIPLLISWTLYLDGEYHWKVNRQAVHDTTNIIKPNDSEGVKYPKTYPSREFFISQIFHISSSQWCLSFEKRVRIFSKLFL